MRIMVVGRSESGLRRWCILPQDEVVGWGVGWLGLGGKLLMGAGGPRRRKGRRSGCWSWSVGRQVSVFEVKSILMDGNLALLGVLDDRTHGVMRAYISGLEEHSWNPVANKKMGRVCLKFLKLERTVMEQLC